MRVIQKQIGFTLVELISVIVLLGIVGLGVVGYLRSTTEAFNEITRRDEMAQVGRFAVEKLSRELRHALPGSIRIANTPGTRACIEFVPIIEATVYASIPYGISGSTIAVLTEPPVSSGTVAVYTLVNSDVYSSNHHRASFAAYSGPVSGEYTLTLSPSKNFPEQSPHNRLFYIETPVSYCVLNNQLRRYSGYGFNNSQPDPPVGGVLVAENLQLNDGGNFSPFIYSSPGLQSVGIVHVDFRFLARDTTDEWLRFGHDVAIRNVP